MFDNDSQPARRVFTVARLNQEVHRLLESSFGTLWLQGELSNFSRPASGHFYFSMKDSQAQIRCAMFKSRNRQIDFKPTDGDEVLVRGRLGLYAARGDFQLIVEHMEPAGEGRLRAAFEKTKRELEALGWFSSEHKQPLPAMPNRIGLITSRTGAAIRDVLNVLQRRYPFAGVVVYPTAVQGKSAAGEIAAAIATANLRAETDVLLVVRGGGSLEDLWAFNEIAVADAIFHSALPVVSGVGHEVDFTIADLVADVRAPTPSAAAEIATPDRAQLDARFVTATAALQRQLNRLLTHHQHRLHSLCERLRVHHPERLLEQRGQRQDDLRERLQLAMRRTLQRQQIRCNTANRQLQGQTPELRLQLQRQQLKALEHRMAANLEHRLQRHQQRFAGLTRALHAISPLATLDRGFAVLRKGDEVITDPTLLAIGDRVTAMVARGNVDAKVINIHTKSDR